MKISFILPLLFLAFLSCSKKNEVDPDLGTLVAGTYQATYLEAFGEKVTLPQDGISVGILLARIDNENAEFLMTSNIQGEITQEGGDVTLKRSGDRILIFAPGSLEMGYVKGKELILDFVSVDGNRVKVEASR